VKGEPSAGPVAFLGVRAVPVLASGCALGSRHCIAVSALLLSVLYLLSPD